MDRLSHSRSRSTDLLARPPSTAREIEDGWPSVFLDPVAQLEGLADLWARGLLSREEFERQKARLFER
jgi:hypothetical protein